LLFSFFHGSFKAALLSFGHFADVKDLDDVLAQVTVYGEQVIPGKVLTKKIVDSNDSPLASELEGSPGEQFHEVIFVETMAEG
jgi:hypothetical protein